MPTPKKPRKARKLVSRKDVVSTLFNADEPMQEKERNEVLTQVHMAALALSRGFGAAAQWDELIVAFNIAVNVCAMANNSHIGLSAVNEARNALINMRERSYEIGRFVFIGDELATVNGGIHVFEMIVATVSRRQYVQACAKYTSDLKAGKAMRVKQGQPNKRFEIRQAA
jgi:hypothetical protein